MVYDVVVVSAFGRGHWLAVDLTRKGMKVVLLDATDSLGSTSIEEMEGPFGFFQSERINSLQLERLMEDDAVVAAEQGFVIWLKEGPLEMKGPLTKHRLAKLKISDEVQQYLSSHSSDVKKKNFDPSFEKSWLVHLAHSFSAQAYYDFIDSKYKGPAAPLFANFQMRMTTRQGYQKSLAWLKRNDVQVIESAQVVDMSFVGRQTLNSLEIRTGSSGKTQLLEARQFVWELTSEETGMLGERVQNHIYPYGYIEPDWAWSRFRLKIEPSFQREQIPLHSLIIGDLTMPWAHENFCLLLRTGSQDIFDAWIRIANIQRFNRDYLLEKGTAVVELIRSRLPQCEVAISVFPTGYEHTYLQTGPTRFPVYSSKNLRSLRTRELQNVYFDSPEQWTHLGWEGALNHQKGLSLEIFESWQKWLQKQKAMKQEELNP